MNKKTTRLVLFIALIIVVIVGVVWQFNRSAPAAAVTSHDYKNITYTIEGQPVTLVNGNAVQSIAPGSASQIETRYFGNETVGDLNGDGKNDIAFILTQSGGGSGTFYYVVAAIANGSGYSGTNAVLLGDRIAPQTTQIQNGELIVNYADRAATDSMTTAPHVGISKYLKLSGAQLVAVSK